MQPIHAYDRNTGNVGLKTVLLLSGLEQCVVKKPSQTCTDKKPKTNTYRQEIQDKHVQTKKPRQARSDKEKILLLVWKTRTKNFSKKIGSEEPAPAPAPEPDPTRPTGRTAAACVLLCEAPRVRERQPCPSLGLPPSHKSLMTQGPCPYSQFYGI